MSCVINSCTVASPLYGIVGRKGCNVLIPVQSLLLRKGLWGGKDVMHYFLCSLFSLVRDCGEARMSSVNSCAVAPPSYGIVGRQG